MEIEGRVARGYDVTDEEARLWKPGVGELVRLRTWDIFDRFLPPQGRILDVGGGPGAHAAYLAERGYRVVLLDPVEKHVDWRRSVPADTPDGRSKRSWERPANCRLETKAVTPSC